MSALSWQSYCGANHNDENISFCIAVQEYKEMFRGQEHLWLHREAHPPVDYDDIAMWPSLDLSKRTVDTAIQEIQDKYLSTTAPLQISVSGAVRYRVSQRMSVPSVYGTAVFDEALAEPVRCLKTLIIPLFLRSQQFAELQQYEQLLEALPTEQEVKLPHVYFQSKDPTAVLLPELSWSDIYRNYDLYNSFYDFMIQRSSGQMLLCRQMISTYCQCFEREIIDIAESRHLYQTMVTAFIAPGSCYDVGCATDMRNQILYGAAFPEKNSFDEVMTIVMAVVEREFEQFVSRRHPMIRKGDRLYRVSCSCIEVISRQVTKTKSKKKRRDTAFPGAMIVPDPAKRKLSFLSWWRRGSSAVSDAPTASQNCRHRADVIIPGRREPPNSVARMITGPGMDV